MSDLTSLFGPLDGAEIPGGCDQCDAYQKVGPIKDGIWGITVYHDDWCPLIKKQKRGRR
jgi:hypothetical protein